MKRRILYIVILIMVPIYTPLSEVWGGEVQGFSGHGYPNSGSYAYPPYPYSYYPYPYWAPPAGYYPPAAGPYGGELIPAGRLIMLVDPVSAEVYVDGLRLVQHEDLSYEVGLLFGQHNVTVKKEGYEPYEKGVEIPGGQQIHLTVRLNPSK